MRSEAQASKKISVRAFGHMPDQKGSALQSRGGHNYRMAATLKMYICAAKNPYINTEAFDIKYVMRICAKCRGRAHHAGGNHHRYLFSVSHIHRASSPTLARGVKRYRGRHFFCTYANNNNKSSRFIEGSNIIHHTTASASSFVCLRRRVVSEKSTLSRNKSSCL